MYVRQRCLYNYGACFILYFVSLIFSNSAFAEINASCASNPPGSIFALRENCDLNCALNINGHSFDLASSGQYWYRCSNFGEPILNCPVNASNPGAGFCSCDPGYSDNNGQCVADQPLNCPPGQQPFLGESGQGCLAVDQCEINGQTNPVIVDQYQSCDEQQHNCPSGSYFYVDQCICPYGQTCLDNSSSSSTSSSSGQSGTSSSSGSGGFSSSSSSGGGDNSSSGGGDNSSSGGGDNSSSGGGNNSSSGGGSGSSSGGSASASGCDNEPDCAGDPIQCAILFQIWKTNCGNSVEDTLDCSKELKCEGDAVVCMGIQYDKDQGCAWEKERVLADLEDFAIEHGLEGAPDRDIETSVYLQDKLGDFLDNDTPIGVTCIPDVELEISFGVFTIPVKPLCDMAEAMRPYLLLIGSFFGTLAFIRLGFMK